MEEIDDYIDNFENWIDDPDYFEGIDCDNEVDLPSLNKKQTSALFLNLLNTSEDLGVNEAKKLIKLWKIKLLAVNLSKFDWLDDEVANKLIEKKYIENLAKNLFSFKNLNKKIAKSLKKNRIGAVASNLGSFTGLDDEVAHALIENGYYNNVSWNIYRFENLSNETLLALLVNCDKYKRLLVEYRFVFSELWEVDSGFLLNLRNKWRILEYEKLREFWGMVSFDKARKRFEKYNRFEKGFYIWEARDAIKYGEWKLIIENINRFMWNSTGFFQLINLLIEWNYIEDIEGILPKLRWRHLDRNWLVHQFSLANNYNVLINNADNFEHEKISNIEIAEKIIENCDMDCRDSVTKLNDYSDEDQEWEWINYNLDFCKIVMKWQKSEFFDLMEYFKKDFSPLPSNRKLPLKLRNLVKEKFWLNTVFMYKDLFKSEK